ncbi:HNH endonuclease [Mycobacterium paragordonae]|uniref:HNH endonuclease n=2 Tax=Mycobacterium paragordonae TaxID=1389713 RepID=UPI0030B8986B
MCNPRRPMYCTNSCSVAARLLAERKRRAARSKSPRPRTCAHCDRDLGSLDIKRQICDSCRAVARRKCRGKHSRRARHYSVEYETVDARKVYARDKWRCGICNRKVDKRLVPPHPMSASLDHVVPMSLGGAHTYANTQCTHWICNTRKGTRAVGEQLALIG